MKTQSFVVLIKLKVLETGVNKRINPLNAELNPIYHLLALLGAHHILHVSRIRVKYAVVSSEMQDGGLAAK